jgi:hypothetical protein
MSYVEWIAPDPGGVTSIMGSPFDPLKESAPAGQNACALFLRCCRGEWPIADREIEWVERKPPLCAAAGLADVSLAASMSAAALSDAINVRCILYAMARTHSLVPEEHSADARTGFWRPQMPS